MRITIVSASIDNSGGFRVVAALGQQLFAKGHDVKIFSPKRSRESLKNYVRALLGRRPFPRLSQHSDYLGQLASCAKIVPHIAPLGEADLPEADVIIATWWDTLNWVKDVPASKGVLVHLVQDYEIWGGKRSAIDAVLRMPGPKIAISSYLHDLLVTEYAQTQVLLLPNAVDHDLFFAAPRGKGTPTTVGFVYSHDLRKGTDLLLKALADARAALPNLKVIAFGHRAPDDTLPLPSWVEYTISPPQDTLRALYARCDAWLFGSRNEGFGLPILEAMACRTPVIGMRAGAAADLLGDECGILLENEDWLGMSHAIQRIATMPDAAWRAQSERAYARADMQRWDRVGATLEDWLKGVIAQPRST